MIPLKDENPIRIIPFITTCIIFVNLGVFMGQVYLNIRGLDTSFVFGMRPLRVVNNPFGFPLVTVFTSIFIHGGVLHLVGNMWFLWIFGNRIEDAVGHFRYLFFYLICGAGSSLVHILSNPHSDIPTIGASGAISGIMGAYFLLYPRSRIVTLIPVFIFFKIARIPAFFFLGFWFLLQLWGSYSASLSGGSGIAWYAHIGGFLLGMVMIKFLVQTKQSSRRRQ